MKAAGDTLAGRVTLLGNSGKDDVRAARIGAFVVALARAAAFALAGILAGTAVVARAAVPLTLAVVLALAIVLRCRVLLCLIRRARLVVGGVGAGGESTGVKARHGCCSDDETCGFLHDKDALLALVGRNRGVRTAHERSLTE